MTEINLNGLHRTFVITLFIVMIGSEISTRFKSAFANCTDLEICVHQFCYIKAYSRKLATLNFSLMLLKTLVKPYYVTCLLLEQSPF